MSRVAPHSSDRFLFTLERLLAIRLTELDEALDQAADLVADALAADKVDAFLYDPTSDSLVARGTSRTPMGHKQHAIGMDRLPLANGGRTAEVFKAGSSWLTGRADRDPCELRGMTEGLGIRSLMCTPLGGGDDRRGVLSVASSEPDRWNQEDLRFLEATARWVVMVAVRAELTERLASQAEAQGRHAAADELIAILAHDLRNHLSPLRGRVQLMHRWASREGHATALRHLGELSRSVDRLGRLISDLLDSARLEQGLFTLEPTPTDLVALARDAAATLRTSTDRIHVTTSVPEVWATADPDRLRQALENLLVNGLKYSPDQTPVLVHVSEKSRADGSVGLLTVADQGPGIPPEVQARLFEQFARGHNSQGLGLGLYLAHRIAEAHGGTLSVDATAGVGTRFTLAIPLERA